MTRIAQYCGAGVVGFFSYMRAHPAARWAVIIWVVSLVVVSWSAKHAANVARDEAADAVAAYSLEADLSAHAQLIETCQRNNARWLAYNLSLRGLEETAHVADVRESAAAARDAIAAQPDVRSDGTTDCYAAYPPPQPIKP